LNPARRSGCGWSQAISADKIFICRNRRQPLVLNEVGKGTDG
jgi:hypothetical protein